jgi:phosphoribosylamine--glycine ligase
MIADGRPKVLEFNVRLGDPEAQVLLARLRSDLCELVERTCSGTLAGAAIEWDPRAAACVVLAAEGYPGGFERGRPIAGLDALRGWRDGVVFHAGTRRVDDVLVTDGGRVLGVTALGDTVEGAVAAAYGAVDKIRWPGMHYRHDIGHRALATSA